MKYYKWLSQQLALVLRWGPPYFTRSLAEAIQSRPLYQGLIMLLRALPHLNHATDTYNRVQIKSAHWWSALCSSQLRFQCRCLWRRRLFLLRPPPPRPPPPTPERLFPRYSACYRLPSLQFSGGRANVVELQLRARRAQRFGRKILATTIYLEDKALKTFA